MADRQTLTTRWSRLRGLEEQGNTRSPWRLQAALAHQDDGDSLATARHLENQYSLLGSCVCGRNSISSPHHFLVGWMSVTVREDADEHMLLSHGLEKGEGSVYSIQKGDYIWVWCKECGKMFYSGKVPTEE